LHAAARLVRLRTPTTAQDRRSRGS
jgi:hypothetical protein